MQKQLPAIEKSQPVDLPREGLVRLADFVGKGKAIPVSKSTWYSWVKAGKAVQPMRLGSRLSVYDVASVRSFIRSYGKSTSEEIWQTAKHFRLEDEDYRNLHAGWASMKRLEEDR